MQWAANRARGAHCVPTKGKGRGKAPGSKEARQRARTLTLVCRRVGCSALVNKAPASAWVPLLLAAVVGRCLQCVGSLVCG